jgi:hypothetical protein
MRTKREQEGFWLGFMGETKLGRRARVEKKGRAKRRKEA